MDASEVIVVRCGAPHLEVPAALPGATLTDATPADIKVLDADAAPTRAQLKALDVAAAAHLPHDPTPSLDEIAARPDVTHLGAPAPAPQPVQHPLRVVVVGTDAALSAVLTRMMRADYMWVEVGYVPLSADSTAARNWGLPQAYDAAFALAATAPVCPAPLIRNDAGIAVAGSATITDWDGDPLTGEIIVDDHVLARSEGRDATLGARLVPTTDAPGILAARLIQPARPSRFNALRARLTRSGTSAENTMAAAWQADPASVATGRAMQAGGPQLRVTVDGVTAKRPVKRVTFYRHLRDLQIVRP